MVRGARPSPSVPRRMASFSAARSRGSSMLRAVLSRAMAAVWKPSSFSLSSPGWGHWDASVPRKVQGIWNRVPMLTRTARRLRGSQPVSYTHLSPFSFTGGVARFVVPLCRHEIALERDLQLKGLDLLYRKNRPRKEAAPDPR